MFRGLIPRSWSWSSDLADLHRDLDSLFRGPEHVWWPTAETHVKDDALHLRVDLPGVGAKDVELSLENGHLKLTGERREEKEKSSDGYRYSEVRYGRFERTLVLPEGVDPQKVTARFENGVLDVTVPLPAAPTAQKVPIQVEGPTPAAKHAA